MDSNIAALLVLLGLACAVAAYYRGKAKRVPPESPDLPGDIITPDWDKFWCDYVGPDWSDAAKESVVRDIRNRIGDPFWEPPEDCP